MTPCKFLIIMNCIVFIIIIDKCNYTGYFRTVIILIALVTSLLAGIDDSKKWKKH